MHLKVRSYHDINQGPGKKSTVSLFKDYIVVISPPTTESKGIRSILPNILTRGPDAVEQSKISILDIQNKFIVHSGSVNGGVREVFSSWGNLYLITTGGEVSATLNVSNSRSTN
jgi:hypothetical protein